MLTTKETWNYLSSLAGYGRVNSFKNNGYNLKSSTLNTDDQHFFRKMKISDNSSSDVVIWYYQLS